MTGLRCRERTQPLEAETWQDRLAEIPAVTREDA